MSQRLDKTKCLLLALHVGSVWAVARPITVRTPPSNPSTIEAQAKFFQYRHLPKADQFDQGHRLGSERHFTERHERAKPSEGVFSAKVRWGDKKGGYGEHYWDLNHAGNADNIGDDGDDGSYRENNNSEPYDEPSSHSPSYAHDDSPTYGSDDYDPEKSSYEERERAKRAYPKVNRGRKSEHKHPRSSEQESEEEPRPNKQNGKNREDQESAEISHEEGYENEEEEDASYEKPKPRRQQYKKKETTESPKPKEKNQVVLVVSHKDDAEKQQSQYANQNQPEHSQYSPQNEQTLNQYLPQNQPQLPQYLPQQQSQLPQYAVPKQHLEPPHFVPYEGGAGVRQHQQPEVSAANTVPRLFLEPSTGHVVDRATGQAYVLQPIAAHNNYN